VRIFVANLFGSADAHLNPAITVAFAIKSGDFAKLVPFASAQLAGAFMASVTVWLFYFPHWSLTPDPDVKRAVFCTLQPCTAGFPTSSAK